MLVELRDDVAIKLKARYPEVVRIIGESPPERTEPRPTPPDGNWSVDQLVAALERALAETSSQEVPALMGDLERLKALLWVKMTQGPADGNGRASTEDRLLTEEVRR